jgi:hypothetical protein
MIIGLVGRSVDPSGAMCSLGTGKDTVADILAESFNFQKMGLADPLKRFCRDVYGFTREQLWGPSEFRNKPDMRYPRQHVFVDNGWECACCGFQRNILEREEELPPEGEQLPVCYLTPRYALQTLGTEWGRHCWDDTWVSMGVKTARLLLRTSEYMMYTQESGYTERVEQTSQGEFLRDDAPPLPIKGVVFSDVRFKSEIEALHAAGAKLVLVHRPVEKVAASAKDMMHQSENDLNEFPVDDPMWDAVIYNGTDMQGLREVTRAGMELLLSKTK